MGDGALLPAALAVATAGMACFALSVPPHWARLRGARPLGPARRVGLRVAGATLLAGAFALCVAADPVSMAVLVWTMLLTVAAVLVATALTLHARLARGSASRPGRS